MHQNIQNEESQWTQITPIENAPKFVVFYKEDCPFCAKMHKDFIKMAEDVRFKHFPLNMVAVERGDNAITAHHFGVSQYPTLRLY